ncbi:hypothetical protein J4Q44_G00103310 [Coregonus suidteri]|uniref:Uncharacterized protein n=1 Tax=Coregonus suidteri TaxID=861788 RepID=A0AAN8M721_9TELE
MAPTITSAMIHYKEHLTLTNKLRKPLLEKLPRYRINSSLSWHLPIRVTPDVSKEEVKTQSKRRLLSNFQSLQPSSDKNRMESDLPQLSKEKSPANSALWRP